VHGSTCCSKACMSTPDGRGHSWPPWHLRLGRCIETQQLTMVRAMRFYTLVPRTSADHPTHRATIQWGLPRTVRRRFLSVRRVWQKLIASVSGFWLEYVPLFPFQRLPLVWRSCDHFPCPSNLDTSTRHSCLKFEMFAIYPQIWCQHAFPSLPILVSNEQESVLNFDLHATPRCELLHHVLISCISSGVSAKIKMSSMKSMLLNW